MVCDEFLLLRVFLLLVLHVEEHEGEVRVSLLVEQGSLLVGVVLVCVAHAFEQRVGLVVALRVEVAVEESEFGRLSQFAVVGVLCGVLQFGYCLGELAVIHRLRSVFVAYGSEFGACVAVAWVACQELCQCAGGSGAVAQSLLHDVLLVEYFLGFTALLCVLQVHEGIVVVSACDGCIEEVFESLSAMLF